MPIVKSLIAVFFPASCLCCDKVLLENESIICVNCRHDLPIIYSKDYRNNPIINSFAGKIPIEMASAFLYYKKEGKTQQLIHHLKYKNRQDIGVLIGDWFGNELKKSQQFNQIDCIIPVPLHPNKLKKRGYNQLTTFGNSLAKQLGTVYLPTILIKTTTNKTQTKRHRYDRFANVETTFSLSDYSLLKNRHILLIDDVITTGATLEACCKELFKTPEIKISIVTMAFTD